MTGTLKRSRSRFLARPAVEIIRDGGVVQGTLVRLQRGKAARGLQPDPDALVFVAVDGDGLPVLVDFLERREPLTVLRDLLDLVLRAPGGVGGNRVGFSSPAYLRRLHAALRRASSRLPEVPFATATRG